MANPPNFIDLARKQRLATNNRLSFKNVVNGGSPASDNVPMSNAPGDASENNEMIDTDNAVVPLSALPAADPMYVTVQSAVTAITLAFDANQYMSFVSIYDENAPDVIWALSAVNTQNVTSDYDVINVGSYISLTANDTGDQVTVYYESTGSARLAVGRSTVPFYGQYNGNNACTSNIYVGARTFTRQPGLRRGRPWYAYATNDSKVEWSGIPVMGATRYVNGKYYVNDLPNWQLYSWYAAQWNLVGRVYNVAFYPWQAGTFAGLNGAPLGNFTRC
jgi:hypothetical protein